MTDRDKHPLTALITGGTRGIGRAVAHRLAEQGYGTVIINYSQDDAAAEETRRSLDSQGVTCRLLRANLAFPAEIDGLFERLADSTDRLDAFVHCAALGAFKPLAAVKPNQWDLSMAINARAFLHCVQKSRPLMPVGAIVAISSLGSRFALPNYGAIGPSKAAMEGVVRQLAAELGPHGIRVNAVAGGVIEGRTLTMLPHSGELIAFLKDNTPLRRVGTADDIADVVAFLLSREARWIQGQVIVADGGFSIGLPGAL